VKRTLFAAIAMVSLVGFVRADDLSDSQTKLKDAVAKKSADEVLAGAAETFKLAKAEGAKPQPSEADQVDNWKQHVEYAKEVTAYAEYALAATAMQSGDPAKTVQLVNALIAENPKSKYLDEACANAYLVALGKSGGAAKQKEGMTRIAAGRPDNLVALLALVDSNPAVYANKLVAASKKPKPETVSEADWERMKTSAEGAGYFAMGFASAQKQAWVDCDKNMKAALPLISSDTNKLGIAYFSLGLCEYNFGKLTADRTKMQSGQQYMEKSAATKSTYQGQAYTQANAMKQELAGRH
jgi:hypothetical protein